MHTEQLSKAEYPSIHPFSLCVFEAFQNSARAHCEQPTAPANTDGVIIIKGSFAKGIPMAHSDLDVLGLTKRIELERADVQPYFSTFFDELCILLQTPKYKQVLDWLILSSKAQDKLPIPSSFPDSTTFRIALAEIEPRLPILVERTFRMFCGTGRSETSSTELTNVRALFPYSDDVGGDIDYHSATVLEVYASMRDERFPHPLDSLLLILSSSSKYNAYEAIDGTLLVHQRVLVKAIRRLYERDIEQYHKYIRKLRLVWRNYLYLEQPPDKDLNYKKFFQQLRLSYGTGQYVHPLFGFEEFPGIDVLETLYF